MKRIASFATAAAAATAVALWLAVPAGAAPARPAITGTEHFHIVTTTPGATSESAIVTGVFTAGGVDHPGSKVDTLVFPTGSFKVAHSKGTGTQSLNPKTCLLTVTLKGTITLSGGTGAYAGISGSGTYHFSLLAVEGKSGGTCSMTVPPPAYQQIITGTATVTL